MMLEVSKTNLVKWGQKYNKIDNKYNTNVFHIQHCTNKTYNVKKIQNSY